MNRSVVVSRTAPPYLVRPVGPEDTTVTITLLRLSMPYEMKNLFPKKKPCITNFVKILMDVDRIFKIKIITKTFVLLVR